MINLKKKQIINFLNQKLSKIIINHLLITVLGKIIQLCLVLLLAIEISPKNFTYLLSSVAIAQIISLISIPGGQQGLTARLSKYRLEETSNNFVSYTFYSLLYLIFFTSIIISVIGLISEIHSIDFVQEHYKFLPIILITIFSIYRLSVMRAAGLINESLVPTEIVSPILIIISTIVCPREFIDNYIISIWTGSYLLCEILAVYLCNKKIKVSFNKINVLELLVFNRQSLIIQFSNIFRLGIIRTDLLLVSYYIGPNAAATYALMHRLVQPITIFGRVLVSSTTPYLVNYLNNNETINIEKFKKISLIYVFVILFITFIGNLLFILIHNLYEMKFSLNYNVFTILICSQTLLLCITPITQLILLSKNSKKILQINILGFFVYFMINFYFDKINALSVSVSVLVSISIISCATILTHFKIIK